jgi:cell wall-associated NlpC family hydrolase
MSEAIIQVRPEDVVREARALLDVPWVHQGFDPLYGLDCRGLLLAVAQAVGYQPKEYSKTYRRRSPAEELRAALDDEMNAIEISELREADAVLIKFPRDDAARHVGIIARGQFEQTIIHSYEPRQGGGRVIEEPYRRWDPYVRAAFRWKGIAD